MKRAVVSGLFIATVCASAPAFAQKSAAAKEKQACFSAYEEGQLRRRSSELLLALEALNRCAAEACPEAMRTECATWYGEVEAIVPTLVIEVTGSDGRDVADVTVLIDGQRVASELDGQPLRVDPGTRRLRLERGDWFDEQTLVVRAGEKLRRVAATIPPAPTNDPDPTPTPPETATDSRRTWAWVASGVAVAGLASFAYFGATGSSNWRELEQDCGSRCDSERPDDVSAVRRDLLIADISLGVAAISAGAAVWLFMTSSPSERSPSSASTPALQVRPVLSPTWVGVLGAY